MIFESGISMKLTFLGATGTVTGSKYLLEDEAYKFLIDCGLFQGLKDLRLRNWAKLPINPKEINDVILTHAHIDHSGYIPLLVKEGFEGSVYASQATTELCDILLPDCGHIQEDDARRANKYGYTKHSPAKPLYDVEDAWVAMEQFKPVEFNKNYALKDPLDFSLHRAGHILGAASVKVSDGQTSILFSGDLGRMHDPIMSAPVQIEDTDYLVLESTYGDRLHGDENPLDKLESVINGTVSKGGTVLIPSFAVGRAQAILYYINELKKFRRIPTELPVFLDSPMAIDATALWQKHHNEHRLTKAQCEEVFKVAHYLRTPEESKELNGINLPSIIISASGMATGGRVLHHMKNLMGDPRNTILFAGYQAEGTRGAKMVNGVKEIKFHGYNYPVRSHVDNLDTLSAHADYEEILEWLSHFTKPPRKTFITHGEPRASDALKTKIEERYGWEVITPNYLDTYEM